MFTSPLESLDCEAFELALASDVGTNRPDNEDCCGHFGDGPDSVVFAVADGVGGYEGGEVASRMAIEITLKSFAESPREWGAAKRLQRSVQAANIEIHNRALAVPELRRMATTLTAAAVENGMLAAVHVGDCRLYLLRAGRIAQITKDHTMVAERVRMGLMSEARARTHPERSMLIRSLGRELIVAVDRISMRLQREDTLVLCSDGLYNVLEDHETAELVRELRPSDACRALIDAANRRGTADNLTAVVFRMLAEPRHPDDPAGWRGRLRGLFSKGA